ncbi:MAG: methyltransferase type 11 [Marivirga sp.]|nr:methyltransferase type 11 [Marivirga sp.]
MELRTAVKLIEKGITEFTTKQVWADLGAGTGLFTKALATILPEGSTIYAVDKDATSLNSIQTSDSGIIVKKIETDFSSALFQIKNLDGLLMANSLHYISDKPTLLKRLKSFLKPAGRIILIEYDTNDPNPWVPYPISYNSCQKLVNTVDMSVEKIGEANSVYGRSNMYSALVTS